MNKKNILLTFLLLTIFAATSILALLTAKKITDINTSTSSSDNPDFFMINAIYTKFNSEGKIRNRIRTDKITHQVTENIYLFDNPKITLHNLKEEPWYITSKQGKSEQGKSKIHLWNNVRIIQKPGANNSDFDISTNSITFYPDTKFAETKQAVKMIQHGDIVNSVGAEVDFKTGVVKLLSKIKMLYQIQ